MVNDFYYNLYNKNKEHDNKCKDTAFDVDYNIIHFGEFKYDIIGGKINR